MLLVSFTFSVYIYTFSRLSSHITHHLFGSFFHSRGLQFDFKQRCQRSALLLPLDYSFFPFHVHFLRDGPFRRRFWFDLILCGVGGRVNFPRYITFHNCHVISFCPSLFFDSFAGCWFHFLMCSYACTFVQKFRVGLSLNLMVVLPRCRWCLFPMQK